MNRLKRKSTCKKSFFSDSLSIYSMNFNDSIKKRLLIEIFHNIGLIKHKQYIKNHPHNAEALDRELKPWKDLQRMNKGMKDNISEKKIIKNCLSRLL